uniref:DUF5901 domain-containing protein n=1 Tax=viral metagenome TaxID=1070528 RepID=A0A6C0CHQ0_9ZZZZ
MSVEDITYLKNNSIKQSYVVLIDSSQRDLLAYPDPNYYVINLDFAIKNVIGFEIIDSSVPRTMYSIDKYNNSFYYYIHSNLNIDEVNNIIQTVSDSNTILNYENDPTFNGVFNKFEMNIGDYNIATFCQYFNKEISSNISSNYNSTYWSSNLNSNIIANPLDTDNPEIKNILRFDCDYPFILNMRDSTMSESLGFYLLTKPSLNNLNYTYIDKYTNNINFLKLFHSFFDTVSGNNTFTVIPPGMVCLTGEKYIILHSPEIEDHSFGSLSYMKNTLGIAKFRTNSIGFNDLTFNITKIPIREFHPIGKLTKITFQFVTSTGLLYDFKGVNHNITIAIYYYEAKLISNDTFTSILNPNYNINYNDYKYTNDEQEIINEDDEDEDDNNTYSRDNINIYKRFEQKYSY